MGLLDELRDKVNFYSETLKITEVFSEVGRCRVKMEISDDVRAPFGMVFGGAIFSLAESASALAVSSLNEAYVTMDSTINFLNPGMGEFLYADAEIIHTGDTSCLVEVIVSDEEDVVISKAMFTMFKVEMSAL